MRKTKTCEVIVCDVCDEHLSALRACQGGCGKDLCAECGENYDLYAGDQKFRYCKECHASLFAAGNQLLARLMILKAAEAGFHEQILEHCKRVDDQALQIKELLNRPK